jgi:hypothetical protein
VMEISSVSHKTAKMASISPPPSPVFLAMCMTAASSRTVASSRTKEGDGGRGAKSADSQAGQKKLSSLAINIIN